MKKQINFLKDVLNRPFPFLDDVFSKWVLILFFSFFVYFFLLIFQPYQLTKFESLRLKMLIISGYSLTTLLVLILTFFVPPLFKKNIIDSNDGTVGRLIIFSSINILFISILNWVYHNFVVNHMVDHQSYNLVEFILITLSVGLIPIIILVLWLERSLMKKNMQDAKQMAKFLTASKPQQTNTPIKNPYILLGQTGEKISLHPSEICCIKAEGNYAEIYYYEKEKMKRAFLRTTLSEIQKQLTSLNEKNIILCHRSYIANFEYITHVTGNARNYNLHLKGLHFSVPVSRQFSKNLIKIHKQIKQNKLL